MISLLRQHLMVKLISHLISRLMTRISGSLKIWSVQSTSCIRTFDCGYALCCTFLPGDRQVAVGTKSGEIQVFDLASSALVQSVQAHEGAVWSLHVRGDKVAMVSGSADKDVKFWEFERKTAEDSKFVSA